MSWFDKLMAAVPGTATTARLMGARLVTYPFSLARLMGHREGDIEHLLYGLLSMIDLRKALEAHGAQLDDADAVLDQLLQEKPTCAEDEEPPLPAAIAPRIRAVIELVAPKGQLDITSVAVIRATAAALPRELVFLRKPLEAAAADVGALFDGALAMKDGVLSLEAWDVQSGAAVHAAGRLVKDRAGLLIGPRHLLIGVLSLKSINESLKARGTSTKELLAEFRASLTPLWWTPRTLTKGLCTMTPSLYAVLLRTEGYAAEDASNVRLRHLLAALHDEPNIAPWIEKIAG